MAFNLVERIQVKNRIMGLLLRDAREDAGRNPDQVAELLGIPTKEYLGFEKGLQGPTLPQLEVLAYYYDIPLNHFFGAQKTLKAQREEDELKDRVPELMMLRQRIIGVRVRLLREQAGATIEDVAERTGLRTDQITAVEQGIKTLPVNELEMVAYALKANIDDLVDTSGTIGSWVKKQEQFEDFAKLPDDMREFVLKPINQSYIDLAMKLSKMHVDELRGIAASILEITF